MSGNKKYGQKFKDKRNSRSTNSSYRQNDKQDNQRIVIGRNAVEAALSVKPCRVSKIYAAPDLQGKAKTLLETAQAEGIEIKICSKESLTQKSNSDSHQGILALVSSNSLGDRAELISDLKEKERFLVVALDSITDPHNMGAILRACECFGVDGVVWSKNRSTAITAAVTKVAVGATELLKLYQVSNLAEVLQTIQKELAATIVCADGESGSDLLSGFQLAERLILVLGNEGDGVSDSIKRRADMLLKIPMYGKIDSLNVSQAAAVFLYVLKSK